jgi:hypothetical protein
VICPSSGKQVSLHFKIVTMCHICGRWWLVLAVGTEDIRLESILTCAALSMWPWKHISFFSTPPMKLEQQLHIRGNY